MNICFAMCGMEFGGAERVVSILSDRLVTRGHRVSICILSSFESQISYNLNERIEINRIRTYGYLKTLCNKNIEEVFITYIRNNRIDAVITFSIGVGYIVAPFCKKHRIPYIHSERNDPKRILNNIGIYLKWKRLVNNVDNVVFQTQGAMNRYPKRIRDRSTIILNPFDAKDLPPYCENIRFKEIVNVGRLSKQKRQDVLINAFSQISNKYPDYTLKIYGTGELQSQLEKLISINRLEERVYLMGTRSDILKAINNATLFAFTSDYEGLPNALIEAMALGLPCVSTKCTPGGAEALISNGINGRLVECNDSNLLAKVIDEMLENYEQSVQMGKEARKITLRLDPERIADEWEEYIHKTINQK